MAKKTEEVPAPESEYVKREKTKGVQKEALAEYFGRAAVYMVGGALVGMALVAVLAGLETMFPTKSAPEYTAQMLWNCMILVGGLGLIVGLGTTGNKEN